MKFKINVNASPTERSNFLARPAGYHGNVSSRQLPRLGQGNWVSLYNSKQNLSFFHYIENLVIRSGTKIHLFPFFVRPSLSSSLSSLLPFWWHLQHVPHLHCFTTLFVKVGSLSFSVLAGKVMFRDFAYITPDWSIRALDGYIIFRWAGKLNFQNNNRSLFDVHKPRTQVCVQYLVYSIWELALSSASKCVCPILYFFILKKE